MVSLRNKADNSWHQIDVQLRKRYDLIPNLVETVKGYAKHESETLKGMLIESEICTEDQLVEIEEEHERTGKIFQELLVDYEIISEEELMGLIAQNLGTDIVDLTGIDIEMKQPTIIQQKVII